MSRDVPKVAALLGGAFGVLAILLYAALQVTSNWEQAKSPGEKSLGVAALGMLFGLPMLLCAGVSLLSFVVGLVTLPFSRRNLR